MPDPSEIGPSKTRAAVSFLTGFAVMGSGGAGGMLARRQTDGPKPTPEQKRRVMWGALLMYALVITGGVIGATRAAYALVGVFLGVMAGLLAAGLLLLLLTGASAVVRRLRQ
jgi:hypothetical protein